MDRTMFLQQVVPFVSILIATVATAFISITTSDPGIRRSAVFALLMEFVALAYFGYALVTTINHQEPTAG